MTFLTQHSLGRAGYAWRALLALVACALMVGLSATPAQAHAQLVSTDPENGAALEVAPEKFTLTFSEPVGAVTDAIRLFSASEQPQTLPVQFRDTEAIAEFPRALPDGNYVVSWRVVSADGHPISGTVSFSIGDVSGAAAVEVPDAASETGVAVASALVGALHYVGLLVVFGLIVFERAVLRSRLSSRGVRSLILFSGLAAMGGAVLAMPVQAVRLLGSGLGGILQPTEWLGLVSGQQTLIAAATVLGMLPVLILQQRSDRALQNLVLAGSLLALATPVLTGHTALRQPTWLMVGSDLVHLLAGGVWLGGLVGFVLFLREARTKGVEAQSTSAVVAVVIVARFSAVAALATAVLGLSGVIMGAVILQAWEPLVSTNYGRALLLKIGLVVVVLLIAAHNRYRLVPSIERAPTSIDGWVALRIALLREAALIAAVLTVTGALVQLSPNETHTSHIAESSSSALPADEIEFEEKSGDVAVSGVVTVEGATASIRFAIRDAAGDVIDPLQLPDVASSLPDQNLGPFVAQVSEPDANGMYSAVIETPFPGQWEILIGARVSTFEKQNVLVKLVVAP